MEALISQGWYLFSLLFARRYLHYHAKLYWRWKIKQIRLEFSSILEDRAFQVPMRMNINHKHRIISLRNFSLKIISRVDFLIKSWWHIPLKCHHENAIVASHINFINLKKKKKSINECSSMKYELKMGGMKQLKNIYIYKLTITTTTTKALANI